MSDLVTIRLPGDPPATVQACQLQWSDRGRLVAIRTGAAVYVGYIRVIIFHSSGQVQVELQRYGVRATVTLAPDNPVDASDEWEVKQR